MPATVFLCSKRATGNMDFSYVLDSRLRGNDTLGLAHRGGEEKRASIRLKCSAFHNFWLDKELALFGEVSFKWKGPIPQEGNYWAARRRGTFERSMGRR